jgi:transposase
MWPMARMEIVTGRERRRRWSEDSKLEILQEAATSGPSVAEVARRHDVVPQQIYIWRRQLLAKASADAGVRGALPCFLASAEIIPARTMRRLMAHGGIANVMLRAPPPLSRRCRPLCSEA